ncbi:hypothetical protein [Chitinimonas naiadis]
MADYGIGNKSFNFALLNQTTPGTAKTSGKADTGGFAAQLAAFKTQNFNTLLGAAFDSPSAKAATSGNAGGVSALLGGQEDSNDFLSALTSSRKLTASSAVSGLNMSLFDPQAGYDMMSLINKKEVSYKAQFAELSQMGEALKKMQAAGKSLNGMASDASDADIKAQLQAFTEQYNAWVKQFDADMQSGGVLADTQAAKVSRYELAQSVGSIFHGAADGLQGMPALGLSIDPATGLASLDVAKLDATLASNRKGVLSTVRDFSSNFSTAAGMLNNSDNFIPRQLDNLGRAIQFIADNKTAWQSEFGTGADYAATGAVAQAAAAYKQLFRA